MTQPLPDVDEGGYDQWQNQLYNEEADRKIHGLALTQQANDRMADLSRIGMWAGAPPLEGPPPPAPTPEPAVEPQPTVEPEVASAPPAAAPAAPPVSRGPSPSQGPEPSPVPSPPPQDDWLQNAFGAAMSAGADVGKFVSGLGQGSGDRALDAMNAVIAAGGDVDQFLQNMRPTGPVATSAPTSGAPVPGGPLQDYARQAAQKAGVDPDIFQRQIQQESGFNPNARSPAGATGIAQIVPQYHPGVDPTDPYASLDYAANLMRSNLSKYGGDYAKALAAYNAGGGAVDKYGGVPPFEETQRYVDTILGAAPSGRQQPTPAEGVTRAGAALGTANRDISQFGDPQLTNDEAYSACGPAAAVRFAQRFGRNPTLREATDLARTVGWTTSQGMAGLSSEKALMDKLGVPTKLVSGADWGTFANEARTGNPVTISTQGHYFTADGWDPTTNRFHVGRSGLDLRGGSEWMTPEQMTAVMGPVQGGLLADNPQVAAPSIADQDTDPIGWLDRTRQSMANALAPPKPKAVEPEGAAVLPGRSSVFSDTSNMFGEPTQQAASVGPSQALEVPTPVPPKNPLEEMGSNIANAITSGLKNLGIGGEAAQPVNVPGGGFDPTALRAVAAPPQPGIPLRQDVRDLGVAPQPTILDQLGGAFQESPEIAARRAQAAESPEYRRQQLADLAGTTPEAVAQDVTGLGAGALAGANVSQIEQEADIRQGEQLADGVIGQAKDAGWQPTADQERVARTVLSQVTPMNVLLSVAGAPGGGLVGGSGRAAARALAESALGLGLNIAGGTVASEAAQAADLPGVLQIGAPLVGGALAQLTGHATVAGASRAVEYFKTPEGQAVLRARQRAQFSLDPRGAAEAEAQATSLKTGQGILASALDQLKDYPEEIAQPIREWASTVDAPASKIAQTVQRWIEENPRAATPAEIPGPTTPIQDVAAATARGEALAAVAGGDTEAAQNLARTINYDDLGEVRRQEAPRPPPPPEPSSPDYEDWVQKRGAWAPPEPVTASKADRIQGFMSSNMLLGPHSLLTNATTQSEQLARAPAIRLLAGYPGEAWTGLRMLAAATNDGWNGSMDVLKTGRVQDPVEALTKAPIGIEAPGVRANAAMDEGFRTWGRAQGMGMEAAQIMAEHPELSKAEVLSQYATRINEAGQKAGATSVFADGPSQSLGAQASGLRTRLINDPDPKKQAMGWALYAAMPFSRIPETIWSTGIRRTSPVNEVLGGAKIIEAVRRGDARGVRLAAAETALDSTINLVILNQAINGNITAANDPEHPWSIHLPGDKWLDYRSLGPVATRMGAMASIVEASREQSNKLKPNALVGAIDKTASMTLNQWFLGPTVGVLDLIRTGNFSGAGTKFLTQVGDRLLPAGALSNWIEKSTDPVLRDPSKELPNALWERQQTRIPGLAGLLPAKISTTTGEPQPNPQGGFLDAFAGLENEVPDPVRKELSDLDRRVNYSLKPPPEDTRSFTLANSEIPLTNDERRIYLAARGHFLSDRLKQYEQQYQGWNDDAKARFWQDMIAKSGEAGKAELINKTWGGLQSPTTQQKIREGHKVVGRLEPLPEPTATTGTR